MTGIATRKRKPSDEQPVTRYSRLRDELLSVVADCEHSEHEFWWTVSPKRMKRYIARGNDILEFNRHSDLCYFGVEENICRLSFKSPTRTDLEGFPLIILFTGVRQDAFRSDTDTDHCCAVNGIEDDMTDTELEEAFRWVRHIDGIAIGLTVAIAKSP